MPQNPKFIPDSDQPTFIPDPSIEHNLVPSHVQESQKNPKGILKSIIDTAFTEPEFVKPYFKSAKEKFESYNKPIAETQAGLAKSGFPVEPSSLPMGDIVESMATPGDVTLMLGTGGAGIIPKISRAAARTASGLLTARGIERTYNAESLSDLGWGITETGMGALGLKYPVTWKGREIPKPIPQRLLGAGQFDTAAASAPRTGGVYHVSPTGEVGVPVTTDIPKITRTSMRESLRPKAELPILDGEVIASEPVEKTAENYIRAVKSGVARGKTFDEWASMSRQSPINEEHQALLNKWKAEDERITIPKKPVYGPEEKVYPPRPAIPAVEPYVPKGKLDPRLLENPELGEMSRVSPKLSPGEVADQMRYASEYGEILPGKVPYLRSLISGEPVDTSLRELGADIENRMNKGMRLDKSPGIAAQRPETGEMDPGAFSKFGQLSRSSIPPPKTKAQIEKELQDQFERDLWHEGFEKDIPLFRSVIKRYNTLPELNIAGRPSPIYDDGNRFLPEELEEFVANPVMQDIGRQIIYSLDDALSHAIPKESAKKFEGGGLLFSSDARGLTTKNPVTGRAKIFIDPLGIMQKRSPKEAASGILHTIIHEANHLTVGEHDENFTINLADAIERNGFNDIRPRQELERILTGGTGEYTPEVQKILQQYSISRGRRAAILDPVFGQGLSRWNPESLREENIFASFAKSSGRVINDVKNELAKTLASGGRLDLEAIRKKSGITDKKEFDRVIDEILSQGNLEATINEIKKNVRKTPSQGPMGKLLGALKNAQIDRAIQDEILSQERGRRFAAFEGVKEGGEEGFRKSMAAMAGEYEKVQSNKLLLPDDDVSAMFDSIKFSNRLSTPEKIRAGTALGKLLHPELGYGPLQNNELALMDRVFGAGTSDDIRMLHGGLGVATGIRVAKLANTMKSMSASLDLSAPLRQGLGLIHRREYYNAFAHMFNFARSHKAFEAFQDAMVAHPNYNLSRDAGLFTASKEIGAREEQFLGSYLEDLPKLGKVGRILAAPFAASERGYVGFLNKLRFDTYNSLLNDAEKAGLQTFTFSKGRKIPTQLNKAIANYVNVATGRGNLGMFEKYADDLNVLLFSPRFAGSRIDLATKLLQPQFYTTTPAFVRKQYLKTLTAYAGFIGTVGTLGSFLGGQSKLFPSLENLTDPDYGKVRWGKTRLDPGGGMLQYIVAMSQFLTGKSTSSAPFQGGRGRTYTSGDQYGSPGRAQKIAGAFGQYPSFLENKLSPMAGLIDTWLSIPQRKQPSGAPYNMKLETVKKFAPMLESDVIQLLKENPGLAPLAIPAAFGASLQTYQEGR